MSSNPNPPQTTVPQNPVGQSTSNFLLDNWDKLATLILGGVVGYFGALQAIDTKVDNLSDRIVLLEAEKSTKWDPALNRVEGHQLKIVGLEQQLGNLKDQQMLTDQIIALNTDQFQGQFERAREELLAALNVFLGKYKEAVLTNSD